MKTIKELSIIFNRTTVSDAAKKFNLTKHRIPDVDGRMKIHYDEEAVNILREYYAKTQKYCYERKRAKKQFTLAVREMFGPKEVVANWRFI